MEENEINIEYEGIDVMPSCSFNEELQLCKEGIKELERYVKTLSY